MMSLTCVWTPEAVEEVRHLLQSRDYYVNIDGSMTFSFNDDIIALYMQSMTS